MCQYFVKAPIVIPTICDNIDIKVFGQKYCYIFILSPSRQSLKQIKQETNLAFLFFCREWIVEFTDMLLSPHLALFRFCLPLSPEVYKAVIAKQTNKKTHHCILYDKISRPSLSERCNNPCYPLIFKALIRKLPSYITSTCCIGSMVHF